MRVAVWHNLPSGGGKRALRQQVDGLVRRGHEVTVWSPPTADLGFAPLPDAVEQRVVPLDEPRLFDLVPARLARQLDLHALSAAGAHARRCAAEIREHRPDVLLAHACRFLRVTSLARHLPDVPSVLYLQEPLRRHFEAMPRPLWAASEHRGARRLLDGAVVRQARVRVREEVAGARAYDRLLVNSLFSREGVLRAYGLDAAVCYLGVDTAWWRDPGGTRERAVVGVGAFVPEKNVELVVRAVATVEPRPPLWWFGNVASPEYLDGLRGLARDLGVDFRPEVAASDETVRDALGRAAVMAYAPRLEPFGFAPLEAGACGTPVVAVAEGGVRETVVDGVNGLLAEPSPAALGAAVARVLDGGFAGDVRAHVERHWGLAAAEERLQRHLDEVAS